MFLSVLLSDHRDRMVNKITGINFAHCLLDTLYICPDGMPVIRGKLKYGYLPAGKVLLITEILIRGDEEIKFTFGQFQEFTIFDSTPSAFVGAATAMPY